ncbi:uncharacterized protein SAPINGB_P001319 [Magnusiomyces paraingens]|uniref:Protein phosphatase methylesterase 1 n=1 Tax=Magnusiomyces paraingens TaxID=2606893 RepID=A0A5E8B543_9ASCO|nr:uncharacterized protein SAPINGB_P001319 [Saprochaete ingens]VVT46651.1 unnamed protein product [Saprochaete ingens]
MSDLQRNFFRRKIQDRENQLQRMGLTPFAEEEEEENENKNNETIKSSTPKDSDFLDDLPKPPPIRIPSELSPKPIQGIATSSPGSLFGSPHGSTTPRSSKYKPRDWADGYFDERFTISVHRADKQIDFTVYFTAPSDPLKMPAFVFHHGAGSSALSFACAARDIKQTFKAHGAATPSAANNLGGAIPSIDGAEGQSQVGPISSAFGGVSTSLAPKPLSQTATISSSPGGIVPGMGIGSLSAVAPLPVGPSSKPQYKQSSYSAAPMMTPIMSGMIPLPGSGIPATVYPGSPTAVAQPPPPPGVANTGIETTIPEILQNEETTENEKKETVVEDGETPCVFAFDARYHGSTKVYNVSETGDLVEEPFEEMDMSLETLTRDMIDVINKVYETKGWGKKEDESTPNPSLILVGHSLGGSVVTSVATESAGNIQKLKKKKEETGEETGEETTEEDLPHLPGSVSGVAVLDVVEGTAIESLQTMNMILDSRPLTFPSIERGIEWHLRSKALRNPESACISVPCLLRPQPEHSVSKISSSSSSSSSSTTGYPSWSVLPNLGGKGGTAVAGGRWEWVTNLRATEPFWRGWFTGLSARFLRVPAARLLVLAGTDRLDKDLMIGQMQGKYQLVVFQEAGHFIQEDVPYKTAHLFYDFYLRNVRSQSIVPVFGSFRKD